MASDRFLHSPIPMRLPIMADSPLRSRFRPQNHFLPKIR
ncbi:hypothetical protein LINPERHAP1_LOCUS41259 [Linum perenne]